MTRKHINDINYDNIDLVFSGLPHDNLHNLINNIPKNIKVIDMSSDFRFKNVDIYNQYYETEHNSKELLKDSVYGLTEINRSQIKSANFIACPGCYPTSAIIPLYPLIKNNLIDNNHIIIDS